MPSKKRQLLVNCQNSYTFGHRGKYRRSITHAQRNKKNERCANPARNIGQKKKNIGDWGNIGVFLLGLTH